MADLIRTLTGTSRKSVDAQDNVNHGQSPLTKTTTTNTQTGVLNHLSEAQELKLVEFKDTLLKDGWWSPDAVNGKPTHDDGTLLRFLRARKFDIDGAVGQFTDTEKWMKEQQVEHLYEHFDVDFFERTRQLYPQWTGRRDKRGIPLYVYEIKGLDSKTVDKYQKESTAYKAKLPTHKDLSTPAKMLPLFALYHNLLNFVLPFCSTLERPRPEVPVTNSTNIVDISGVSLRQFWNLKAHMQDASVLATAHYPETLDRIFIIGAPSFFPTVWGWVKRWFDPVTVSKIFILSKTEVLPTLQGFMELSDIPKKYGGELAWAWGDMPSLDAETREALERNGNKGWVKGPALWLNNERLVVGSDKGKARRSDKEVADKKPIIYAADYTDVPVHANKKGSVSSSRRSLAMNGKASMDKPRSDGSSTPVKMGAASAAAAAATDSTTTAARQNDSQPQTTPQKQALPSHLAVESIRTSPMGDSQVHMPANQPAAPATTVEYLSSTVSTQSSSKTTETAASELPKPKPVSSTSTTATSTTIPVQSSTEATVQATPAPAGHTQPGPLSNHQTQIHQKIADQLQGESTVVIPAEANGALSHPAIVASSDKSKGLAMEEDKLVLNGGPKGGSSSRPQPERFVTAAEF